MTGGWVKPSVEVWRSLLVELGEDMPVDFMLAWVQHESGGNVCSLGIPNKEAGLFQTYHPDDDRFGATYSELRTACSGSKRVRALTDAEKRLQVRVGVAYLKNRRERARAAMRAVGADWPEGSSDFWCLVKLHHALPAYYSFLPAYKRANGRAPAGWSEFRSWVEGLSDAAFIAAVPSAARWSSASQRARLFNNAESVGKYGGVERLSRALVVAGLFLFGALVLPRLLAVVA